MCCEQFLLKQFRAQSDTHQMLSNAVVQIVGNPALFSRAALNHLTLETRALGDLFLEQRSLLLPQLLEFIALLLGDNLCLLSSCDIHAHSQETHRFSASVCLR